MKPEAKALVAAALVEAERETPDTLQGRFQASVWVQEDVGSDPVGYAASALTVFDQAAAVELTGTRSVVAIFRGDVVQHALDSLARQLAEVTAERDAAEARIGNLRTGLGATVWEAGAALRRKQLEHGAWSDIVETAGKALAADDEARK